MTLLVQFESATINIVHQLTYLLTNYAKFFFLLSPFPCVVYRTVAPQKYNYAFLSASSSEFHSLPIHL